MKKLLVIILLQVYSMFSFGQQLPDHAGALAKTAVLVEMPLPLLIVNSQETTASDLIIAPNNLRILKTSRDAADLVPFGEKGRNGVVLAALKSKIPLFRLDEVLDYYKVAPENRKLKVLVDNSLVNTTLFLADIRRIEKIEVVKQDPVSSVRYSWDANEQFINIVTMKK